MDCDKLSYDAQMPPWYRPIPRLKPFKPEPIAQALNAGNYFSSQPSYFANSNRKSAFDQHVEKLYEAAKLYQAAGLFRRMYENRSPQYTHRSQGPYAFQTNVYDNGIHPRYR